MEELQATICYSELPPNENTLLTVAERVFLASLNKRLVLRLRVFLGFKRVLHYRRTRACS